MFKISFYVPEESCETVKQALFDAGAGHIGNYDCCAWQTLGQGQFRPLAGANPHLGKVNKTETVQEYLVEMVCEKKQLKKAISALKAAHPYETPAYAVWEINSDY